ncbi:MAG: FAD-binding protein [Actinobacteria bacterium]|nr:FAD-binding protein [Actinomycetota bacterium]
MVSEQGHWGMPVGKPLEEAVVQEFAANLRGELIRPEDGGYDATRAVFNGMIDKRPAMIVRCAGTADVIQGVNFARTHDLLLSVHAGGHSVAGNAVSDGGLMLDLSPMKGIRVDPARRIAQAQAGLTLGEFDHETQVFELATTLGVVSMTGIAGLTLGGGLGWLNGKHGLACDNLISADVVTADGRLLTARDEENEDLFWGVRGGGGNFGVVTSFEYQLHPVGSVLGGGLRYSAAEARDFLRFYHEFASTCPDELSTAASLGHDPDGRVVVGVAVCYCGPIETGERVLHPLRTFGSPLEDSIQPMSYQTLQSAPDGVDPAATAFRHRDEHYDFLILSQWADPSDSEENIQWTRALFDAMQPFFEAGVYVNNLGEEGEDRVKEAYGEHYERLVALKDKYDPTNLFRFNQNVKPAAQSGAPS